MKEEAKPQEASDDGTVMERSTRNIIIDYVLGSNQDEFVKAAPTIAEVPVGSEEAATDEKGSASQERSSPEVAGMTAPRASRIDGVDLDLEETGGCEHFENRDMVASHREEDDDADTPPPIQPLPTLARQRRMDRMASQQAGAFSGAPGQDLQRRDNIRFSLVGIQLEEEEITSINLLGAQPNDSSPLPLARISTGQLATATPVAESALPDVEAQPFDPTANGNQHKQRGKQQHSKFVLIFAMICIFCIVIVAVIVGVALGHSKKEAAGGATTVSSMAPSEVPSSAPTGSLDLLMNDLPEYTWKSLMNISSPQWRALDWLSRHPEIDGMEEWRKRQLFALSTFYFAMGGEQWREDARENWLLYDKSECFWFSTEFGLFGSFSESGMWQEDVWYNITPCNEQNKFQNLNLAELGSKAYKPFIPPEISLLTSLTVLAMPINNISAPISGFLPSQLYQMENLTLLNLHTNKLTGTVPSDLWKMTNMLNLTLNDNDLSGPIPREVGMMTSARRLSLQRNSLTGPIPTEVGLMTNMVDLNLGANDLNGPIPSQLGMMTSMWTLHLYDNSFTGSIPTEVGLMTKMVRCWLSTNNLNGPIPTELGLLTRMTALSLFETSLTGPIPTEVGRMTRMNYLSLIQNRLSGSIPSELGLLTNTELMEVDFNALTGTIPVELASLALNSTLEGLTLANNSLSGVVPEEFCSLGLFNSNIGIGLSFDCIEEQLCGCCWCPCPGSNYTTHCVTDPFIPRRDDKDWPGMFPTPVNRTNIITINIRTDEFPEETTFVWSVLQEEEDHDDDDDDKSNSWKVLDSQGMPNANSLHSYTKHVKSDTIYRLELFDSYADGTCCYFGLGWFAITNSTPSRGTNHTNEGSVVWEATGDALESSMDVFLRIDYDGHAQLYHTPEGYDLFHNATATFQNDQIPVSGIVNGNSAGGTVMDSSVVLP